PMRAGREFTEQDTDESPKVAIISKAMARSAFAPGVDPIGQRLRLFDPTDPDTEWHTIVGVVADARYREVRDARWDVYVPYRQFAFPVRYITVRTASDPAAFAAIVRREVAALDPQQAVTSVKTTRQLFSENVARPRFNSLLLGLLASLAALLAGLGIYGVISYSVAERTREIGVRIALGAQRGDVLRLVLKQGLTLILGGIVIGLVAAFLLARLMESLLFGISAADPATFIVVSLLLIVVALLACYIPARRAMRVDPMVALRYE
ncbi:MAG: ABC transporter permease, partial [Acidobacteriota bacterium]|nr:ABC transporter permease [Acidobacteriota bacterium]